MTLVNKIKSIYPSLTENDFDPIVGTIALQNDSDGKGDYIKFWNHPTLKQPTQEELDAV
jgi:hypothetical protein